MEGEGEGGGGWRGGKFAYLIVYPSRCSGELFWSSREIANRHGLSSE